jgi:hypothetical protein
MDHQVYLKERLRLRNDYIGCKRLFEEAKKEENEDREVFAREREGWEILGREDLCSHPHKSLIPVYDLKTDKVQDDFFRIEPLSPGDCDKGRRVFALDKAKREAEVGNYAVTPSLKDFKSTFLDVFCEGQLRYLNWNNVFAAGGGVLACAQPVPEQYSSSFIDKRNYFHDLQYSSSDVDLFLYGLNENEARSKLVEIYKAVSEANPNTVVCFRSAHAVTLVSKYPFRHIQIVLRLYSSPYEVLAGFDVDSCTIGFDGSMIYTDARAHNALVTCKNTIDVTRRRSREKVVRIIRCLRKLERILQLLLRLLKRFR